MGDLIWMLSPESLPHLQPRTVSGPALVAALYNHTRPLGLGMLAALASGLKPMSLEEAREVVAAHVERQGGHLHFDYVVGRPLKLTVLKGVIRDLSLALFDRDAGPGMFAAAWAEAQVTGRGP